MICCCLNCRHWSGAPTDIASSCRRYPPRMVQEPSPEGVATAFRMGDSIAAGVPVDPQRIGAVIGATVVYASRYPETIADDICGEWVARPDEVQ